MDRDYFNSQRVASIDIFRALTMFLMIFVNDFWTIINVPKWMEHAGRNVDFLGLADVVIPAFLFAVGMSIPLAIETRYAKGDSKLKTLWHILLRTFALLFMGTVLANAGSRHHEDALFSRPVFILLTLTGIFLVWNLYPRAKDWKKYLFIALQIIGVALLVYLIVIFRDRRDNIMRIHNWAVLYLIGWSYFLGACAYFVARRRMILHAITLIALILLSMAGTNKWLGFFDGIIISNGALQAFTMAGIIVSLALNRYGSVIGIKKLLAFFAGAGAVYLLAGFVARNFWIISKLQYTPTWVFFCTGVCLLFYAFTYWLVEMKGKERWFKIIMPAGTATLTCYLVPFWLYPIDDMWGHFTTSLPNVIRECPVGLIKSLVFCFMVIGITWVLGKLHIKLKV